MDVRLHQLPGINPQIQSDHMKPAHISTLKVLRWSFSRINISNLKKMVERSSTSNQHECSKPMYSWMKSRKARSYFRLSFKMFWNVGNRDLCTILPTDLIPSLFLFCIHIHFASQKISIFQIKANVLMFCDRTFMEYFISIWNKHQSTLAMAG